jgi:hypothetical protein
MSIQTRGGVPYVLRRSVDGTGGKVVLPFLTSYLKVRNKGSGGIVRLYFTEADFDANENYIELPVATAILPYGEWEGPVETVTGEREHLWLKSAAGSNEIELVAFQRRG